MRALKPWKMPTKGEMVQEQHIIMKRLIDIENKQFANLKQQLKEFHQHQEIVENRKKWFLQSYKLTERSKSEAKKKKLFLYEKVITKSKSSKLKPL